MDEMLSVEEDDNGGLAVHPKTYIYRREKGGYPTKKCGRCTLKIVTLITSWC